MTRKVGTDPGQLSIVDGLVGEVIDAEVLHRRIHPLWMRPDGTYTSGAFTDPEMSVDRASMRSPAESLMGLEGFGLCGFSAQFARGLDQKVLAKPEMSNLAHAEVVGKKTKAIQKRFARGSRWVVQPHVPGPGPGQETKPDDKSSEPPPPDTGE